MVKPDHIISKRSADYDAAYFNGGKSCQKYLKITRENIFHMYSERGKSFQYGIVPVARYI